MPKAFKLPTLKKIIERWQVEMHDGDGWNSIYFGEQISPTAVKPKLIAGFGSDRQS